MKNGWITKSIEDKFHYVDDKIHNDDGPAVIWSDGTKFWYKHGKPHREDGPAVESGSGAKEWWYKNKLIGTSWQEYTKEKFEQWLRLRAFL